MNEANICFKNFSPIHLDLAGDVHFDDDEIFTIKDESDQNKKKLLWIAVHELGHSLGLEHSDKKGAVMFPWYQHFKGNDFVLTEDDRLGIQTLYGKISHNSFPPFCLPPQPLRKLRHVT